MSRFAGETSLDHYIVYLQDNNPEMQPLRPSAVVVIIVVSLGSSAAKESDFRTAVIGSLECHAGLPSSWLIGWNATKIHLGP